MALEPMHAAKYTDITKKGKTLLYPVFAQPKLDGIRAVAVGGEALSRTWKPLPNLFVQQWFKQFKDALEEFDGELIVGDPTAEDCYTKTMSGIMSAGGQPDFKYYVFDLAKLAFDQGTRLNLLRGYIHGYKESTFLDEFTSRLGLVETVDIMNEEELMAFEADCFAKGYEGIITRKPNGFYKHGRATPVTQELVKMKRFVDEEAEIIGFEELMSNQNEATINAYGRTKRSSHQANKVPQGILGAFVVRNARGTTYNVGMGQGLDMALRRKVWESRDAFLGQWITVRFAGVPGTTGGYEKPRFPGFHGFRVIGT